MDIKLIIGVLGQGLLHSFPAIYCILPLGAFGSRVVSVLILSLTEIFGLVALEVSVWAIGLVDRIREVFLMLSGVGRAV